MMTVLTQYTAPYGTEELIYDDWLRSLGMEYHSGIGWVKVIGEGSRTMFSAHVDSACSSMERVTHVVSNNGRTLSTDESTILSADDKAGVATLLHLMACKVPGTYWFFIGEESGRIGSKALSESAEFDPSLYDRVICFDRKGYTDIIGHQSCGRTCSTEFGEALSDAMAERGIFLEPDVRGSYTDSASFAYQIPECTNISCGYFDAHRKTEYQDIFFLRALINAAVQIDWESLPIGKEPLKAYTYSTPSSKGTYPMGFDTSDGMYFNNPTPANANPPGRTAVKQVFDRPLGRCDHRLGTYELTNLWNVVITGCGIEEDLEQLYWALRMGHIDTKMLETARLPNLASAHHGLVFSDIMELYEQLVEYMLDDNIHVNHALFVDPIAWQIISACVRAQQMVEETGAGGAVDVFCAGGIVEDDDDDPIFNMFN